MEGARKIVKGRGVRHFLWILIGCMSLSPAKGESPESSSSASDEVSPKELKVCEDLLFNTRFLKDKLAWLEKRKVRWFFMNYKRGELVFFEFRDRREDMDHYPFIYLLAVNPKTKECFQQLNDLERIH
jgi:hypothetical protein